MNPIYPSCVLNCGSSNRWINGDLPAVCASMKSGFAFLKDLSWTKGMTFEVNYADIQLDAAIQAQNGQALLTRCAATNDPLACATITRTASG